MGWLAADIACGLLSALKIKPGRNLYTDYFLPWFAGTVFFDDDC